MVNLADFLNEASKKPVAVTAVVSSLLTLFLVTLYTDSQAADCYGATRHTQPKAASMGTDKIPSLAELYKALKLHDSKHFENMKTSIKDEGDKIDKRKKLIQSLKVDLEKKLEEADKDTSIPTLKQFTNCKDANITYDDETCIDDECLRHDIPQDLEKRLENIVFPKNLNIPRHFLKVIKKMGENLKARPKILILNAISDNHFNEFNGMWHDWWKFFSEIKDMDYKFVVYDLGLKPEKIEMINKYTNATVFKFPCNELPNYFCNPLKSFAWKMFIIAAHLQQADVIMWADTSIRITNTSAFRAVVETTRRMGVQQMCGTWMEKTPFHTLPQMPEAFGDSPCLFQDVRMSEGGFGLYHNEPLVWHAVLKPLVACASHAHCMVPREQWSVQWCLSQKKSRNTIGWCHRVDQSALSIVLAKLFREKYLHFAVIHRWWMKVARWSRNDWEKQEEELKKKMAEEEKLEKEKKEKEEKSNENENKDENNN